MFKLKSYLRPFSRFLDGFFGRDIPQSMQNCFVEKPQSEEFYRASVHDLPHDRGSSSTPESHHNCHSSGELRCASGICGTKKLLVGEFIDFFIHLSICLNKHKPSHIFKCILDMCGSPTDQVMFGHLRGRLWSGSQR